jgi:Tol biopolymer transport system component
MQCLAGMRSLLSAAVVVLAVGCFAPVDEGGRLATPTNPRVDEGPIWVAFDTDRNTIDRDIWAVRADGTDLRPLVVRPGVDQHPAFSPDGWRLAFVSDRAGALDVHLLELQSGAVSQLTHGGGARHPSWSHDSQQIVFARDTGIYTVDVSTGVERQVTDGKTPGLEGDVAWRYPVFSPDGKTIAADNRYALYSMDAQRGGPQLLIPITAAGEMTPSYSDSGSHIAFTQYVGNGLNALFIMPSKGLSERASNPGSGARRVTSDGAPSSQRPAWLGPRIVYEQGTTEADLMLVEETGGSPTPLTSGPADDRNPAWASVGTALPEL